jgi:ariadne-1
MASTDGEDYYDAVQDHYEDDDEDYYDTYDGDTDEDYYNHSDGYGCSNDEVDSDEDRADKSTDDEDYVLEVEDDVRRRQDAAIAKITERLSVPPGLAAALLRRCLWDPEQLENEWFSDDGQRRVCDAAGVSAGGVPTALNDRDLVCGICFVRYGPGEMRSAGCGAHFYCHECWCGYVRGAVRDGPRCLSLRCPDPRCSAAVLRELVDAVAGEEDRERYAMFAVRSFVEEGRSKLVRWCPGRGCTVAIRSNIGLNLYEVSCAWCEHEFCFRCGEEAHRPVSCETAREWVAKHGAEGETADWVLANAKHCPKCRRAIEKDQGCMHMMCTEPCNHEFCWLCLGPWESHGRDYFSCNRYNREKAEGRHTETEAREEQAKASLERYLHYYERWTAYGDKKARAAAADLDAFAQAVGVPATEVGFLREAYRQVAECRRVMRWTYAYVYYLDPERDAAKLEFIEYLQGEAESALEKLHDCAERERQDIVVSLDRDKYKDYREKLVRLSRVTRTLFSNFVKAFEAGLAEVVA